MRLSKRVATAAVSVTAVIAVVGVQAPAMARDVKSCQTTKLFATRTCTTGAIKSNSNHDLRVEVNACDGSPWKVWDVDTGKTVASGKGKGQADHIDRVINGLYGTYKAKLSDACRYDLITVRDY